jgi:hypothetical protein|tara:strand:- start:123 stop:371 length:249 start_codon:yes stop_codon:yes gene_type:complete
MTAYKIIQNGQDEPSLREAQKFVGGYVEGINFPNGDYMLVNEEGKLTGLAPNLKATKLYSVLSDDVIVGPAILIKASARKAW